jgi:hypothetical protein
MASRRRQSPTWSGRGWSSTNAEHLLNSAIIVYGEIAPVLDAKVTPEFFTNPEDREVFVWIKRYWSEYGQVPGTRVLKNDFPTYPIIRVREPLEAYLDEVRHRRKFGMLFEALSEATEQLEANDVDAAENTLATGLQRAQIEVSELRDTDIVTTWEERLERYAEWKQLGRSLRGIPSGFPTIDDGLRGFQPEQLITFVGEPKVGKSTMMLRMAIEAHDFGKSPLFFGFEMSNDEQEARYDAMVSGISYTRLLAGKLTDEETETLGKRLKRRRNADPFIFSSDPEGTTVSAIAAKIEQHKPDIVFIDGVYLMDDENGEPKSSPQALTNITRACKKLAQRRRIPIVISTQVLLWKYNRQRGLDGNAIGYSSSFIQDSDAVLAVEHYGDESDPIKKVSIVMARSAPKRTTLVNWDWEHGLFTELLEEAAGERYGTDAETDTEYAPKEGETKPTTKRM